MLDLLNEKYDWINWVKVIDSWIKWPNVWISVCTHWGEHAWLKTLEYLTDELDIENNLTKWKIYFILTNIDAYKKSLLSWNKNPVESRFIEDNLNRCCSEDNMKKSVSYEVKRALELVPILKKLDYHLDIHSTYNPSEAMLITTSNWVKELSNTFNVDTIYSWIPDVQVWKPFIDITERNWWIWIWLEAWCEKDDTWFHIWVENTVRLLDKLWMIHEEKFKNEFSINKTNLNIKVYDSIIVEWKWFIPSKIFKHKDFIRKWEIIATFKDKEYIAKKDSYILMPSINGVWEEYCFLGEI